MKPPSCSRRITKEWIEFILVDHLRKSRPSLSSADVNVKHFKVQGANAGEGYNSELVSLDVVVSLKGESEVEDATDVEFNFIVKFFSINVFVKELNIRFNSNFKEYAIYAEILRDLNNFQASLAGDEFRIHVPELIYGRCSQKEFVLVMENMKVQGYDTNDRYIGLDFNNLKDAVSQIARVHALSYSYNRKHNILDKYPYLKLNLEVIQIFSAFVGVYIDNCVALLNSRKDTEELAKKVVASKERLLADYLSLVLLNEKVPNCIVHGDYWNSNIMFRHDSEASHEQDEDKLQCKILDWGNAMWGSPVLDLHYMIYTSTFVETRKEHLESVLKFYHETFISITSKLNVHVPDWSYEDFQREWQRLEVYGFLMGITLNQGTLSKSNPFDTSKESKVLNHILCLPVKLLTDGLKLGLVKTLVPILMKPSGNKILTVMNRKMSNPIRNEILNGTNEVMYKRLLDLLLEAEEKGLF